jgi:hypothetical protein
MKLDRGAVVIEDHQSLPAIEQFYVSDVRVNDFARGLLRVNPDWTNRRVIVELVTAGQIENYQVRT